MSSPQSPSPQAAPFLQQAPGGAPYAGYTSPIPVKRTHLGHAVASEWTKIRSVRSTMWTLGVYVLLVVGIGMVTALLVAANASDGSLDGENPCPWGSSGCSSAACASSPSAC